MKTTLFIIAITLLTGCVAPIEKNTQKVINVEDGIISNTVPIPPGAQKTIESPQSKAQPAVGTPAITNALAFNCPVGLTNYEVKVSFNLVQWRTAEEGFDYSGIDNANGTWSLRPWTAAPSFYLIKGK